jgi:Zn-finger nucleic acid-binding protein
VRCPIDEETLVISDRQGIEIDYCPKCRGVWLDRGELDKLIEREAERYEGAPARSGRDEASLPYRRERDWDDDDDDDRRRMPGHKRKKKGFLSEMFEFGD